ncbi:MAG: 4'-phosphopantetheinyl transferase family protein [Gammaproteobacteria bacterium]
MDASKPSDRTANPFEELLPAVAASVFSAELPATARLDPAEEAQTGRMVEKRLREFLHGRDCARAALQQLGFAAGAIPKGDHREPVWPEGIVGSITHSNGTAAAAVAYNKDLRAVGIDIESNEPLNDKLVEMICMPEEIARFSPGTQGNEAKLLFSIKESIYKCLWPTVRQYFDFKEMEIRLDKPTGTVTATPHTEKVSPELAAAMNIKTHINDAFVMSAACIRTIPAQ